MAVKPSEPGKKRFHRHIEKAMAKGHILLMHYKKLNGRTVKRRIEPRSWRGNTLVAYDHKRKAVRSFRMERVKHMEKAAFWSGFEKRAASAAELAGLGILAGPSVAHFAGHETSPTAQHAAEIGGLGILAAPYARNMAKAAPAAKAAFRSGGVRGALNVLRHA